MRRMLYSSRLKLRIINKTRGTVLGAEIDIADTSANNQRRALLSTYRIPSNLIG